MPELTPEQQAVLDAPGPFGFGVICEDGTVFMTRDAKLAHKYEKAMRAIGLVRDWAPVPA